MRLSVLVIGIVVLAGMAGCTGSSKTKSAETNTTATSETTDEPLPPAGGDGAPKSTNNASNVHITDSGSSMAAPMAKEWTFTVQPGYKVIYVDLEGATPSTAPMEMMVNSQGTLTDANDTVRVDTGPNTIGSSSNVNPGGSASSAPLLKWRNETRNVPDFVGEWTLRFNADYANVDWNLRIDVIYP